SAYFVYLLLEPLLKTTGLVQGEFLLLPHLLMTVYVVAGSYASDRISSSILPELSSRIRTFGWMFAPKMSLSSAKTAGWICSDRNVPMRTRAIRRFIAFMVNDLTGQRARKKPGRQSCGRRCGGQSPLR